MSSERALDRLRSGGLSRERDERLGVVALLEHASAEERDASGPDRAVLLQALRPQLGAARDQLAHVRDGLHRTRGGEADEPVRVEVIAEKEDRVVIAGSKEPRTAVVNEVPLVDRLHRKDESLLGQGREDEHAVARAPGTQRLAPQGALPLRVERDFLPDVKR